MIGTTAVACALALRTMFKVVVPQGIPVLFGPPTGDAGPTYVCVGYGGDERPGIVGGGQINRYASPQDAGAEGFTVWCFIEAGTGDQDEAALMSIMERIESLYSVCAVAVRQDPKLAGAVGAVGTAEVGAYEWNVDLVDATTASVFFGINVTQGWL